MTTNEPAHELKLDLNRWAFDHGLNWMHRGSCVCGWTSGVLWETRGVVLKKYHQHKPRDLSRG